jgi:hypothetical protein
MIFVMGAKRIIKEKNVRSVKLLFHVATALYIYLAIIAACLALRGTSMLVAYQVTIGLIVIPFVILIHRQKPKPC